MSKVLIINGSPKPQGNTARALAEVAKTLQEQGIETETIHVGNKDIRGCIGCGRCAVSCSDGGHQAIRLNADRKPVLDGKKCVGCHLCLLVCPESAITSSGKRVRKGQQQK
jgi:dihydropyrimidine dehydrogenase (NAD+) subunit PreA